MFPFRPHSDWQPHAGHSLNCNYEVNHFVNAVQSDLQKRAKLSYSCGAADPRKLSSLQLLGFSLFVADDQGSDLHCHVLLCECDCACHFLKPFFVLAVRTFLVVNKSYSDQRCPPTALFLRTLQFAYGKSFGYCKFVFRDEKRV